MNLLSTMLALWASISSIGIGCAVLIVLAELRIGALDPSPNASTGTVEQVVNGQSGDPCKESAGLPGPRGPIGSPGPTQPGLDTTASLNKLPASWGATTRQSFSTP